MNMLYEKLISCFRVIPEPVSEIPTSKNATGNASWLFKVESFVWS